MLFATPNLPTNQLTAVNSINFASIAAQCVYYFTATARWAPRDLRGAHRNFGDIFAGEAPAAWDWMGAAGDAPMPTTSWPAR